MAYLNEQQREELLNQLKDMSFNQANWKLRLMDKQGRLAFYRNAQQTGRWLTRYVLQFRHACHTGRKTQW
jgi:hypothetical protein